MPARDGKPGGGETFRILAPQPLHCPVCHAQKPQLSPGSLPSADLALCVFQQPLLLLFPS